MGNFGYLAISMSKQKKRSKCIFILIQYILNEESFITGEMCLEKLEKFCG